MDGQNKTIVARSVVFNEKELIDRVRYRFSDNRDTTTTQQFLTDEMPENLQGNLVHYSPFQSDASLNSSP